MSQILKKIPRSLRAVLGARFASILLLLVFINPFAQTGAAQAAVVHNEAVADSNLQASLQAFSNTNSSGSNYSCDGGGTWNGSNCGSYQGILAEQYYSCNSGDTLNGSTCTHIIASSHQSYTCPYGGTIAGSSCTVRYSKPYHSSYNCNGKGTSIHLSKLTCYSNTKHTLGATPANNVMGCANGKRTGSACTAVYPSTNNNYCPLVGTLNGAVCVSYIAATDHAETWTWYGYPDATYHANM